ncbi:MAG: hypothetical protein EP347_03125 [Alphaproteobacteria bacterium]|nr:MAG: hypothetical protein EP347_03125 [Alphaproteobacteria bacterium]
MKLDPNALALSSGVTALVLWFICSVFVFLAPGPMMNMTGSMMHADVSHMSWQLNASGFFIGLILWTALSALTGWLVATFYNRFAK